jgi:hypothetical protein
MPATLSLYDSRESDEDGQSSIWRLVGPIAACDDLQRAVGQGPLQRQCVDGIGLKPLVDLGGRRQNEGMALG